MTTPEISIERLLRQRLAKAEAEAPRPPRARELLDLVRPWWEVWPERFREQAAKLAQIQVEYAYAMDRAGAGRGGHPVPVLIAHAEELETFARVLYFAVTDATLRMRFQLDSLPGRAEPEFDVTLVSEPESQPILTAHATESVTNEYRLDADVPAELARRWAELKVTDRMPFRLILRPAAGVR
jgi:hypothetical protein